MVWQTCTSEDGKTFYYDPDSNVTQWAKPAELCDGPVSEWQEFVAEDGTPYYFNAKTNETVWNRPESLIEPVKPHVVATAAVAPLPMAVAVPFVPVLPIPIPAPALTPVPVALRMINPLPPGFASSARFAGAPAKKVGVSTMDNADRKYENPEAAFEELLKDHGTKSFWKWETAMPLIIHDKRYQTIKTIDERKKIFKAYQDKLVAFEREEERKNEVILRNNYMTLLGEVKQISLRSRFKDVRLLLEKDARYKAVSSEKDRENWFYDHIETLERTEKETK